MSEGHIIAEIECENGEKLILRRTDKPGALVKVILGKEEVHVEPRALLLAIKTITED